MVCVVAGGVGVDGGGWALDEVVVEVCLVQENTMVIISRIPSNISTSLLFIYLSLLISILLDFTVFRVTMCTF